MDEPLEPGEPEGRHGPTGKIPPQPWITALETKAVIGALRASGAEVRFIGGCVRDALRNAEVKDVDIATPDPPDAVMGLLQDAGIKAVPTGIEHGTVTAIIGERHFEITTLRKDVETDGRRAKVRFTDDWEADAARRDFTINTLSATPEGDIYNLMGGLEHLAYGVVRFVGVARDRVEEDLLRILRYFRFYATLGSPPPDKEALAACRALAPRLGELSGERVRAEILRILMAPEPADTIALMRGERVLEHILPEATNVGRLRSMTWLDTKAIKVPSVAPDPIRRLAALLEVDADGANDVASRLRLSNAERGRLAAIATAPGEIAPNMADADGRRLLQHLGADHFRDAVLVRWAGCFALDPRGAGKEVDDWLKLIEWADSWSHRAFPLKGQDILDLGVPAGERVGEALRAVEAWWEQGDYRADRTACLARLKKELDGA